MQQPSAVKFVEGLEVFKEGEEFTVEEIAELLDYGSSYPRKVLNCLAEGDFLVRLPREGRHGVIRFSIRKTRGMVRFLTYHVRQDKRGNMKVYKTAKKTSDRGGSTYKRKLTLPRKPKQLQLFEGKTSLKSGLEELIQQEVDRRTAGTKEELNELKTKLKSLIN